jgi:hypothetical protein
MASGVRCACCSNNTWIIVGDADGASLAVLKSELGRGLGRRLGGRNAVNLSVDLLGLRWCFNVLNQPANGEARNLVIIEFKRPDL